MNRRAFLKNSGFGALGGLWLVLARNKPKKEKPEELDLKTQRDTLYALVKAKKEAAEKAFIEELARATLKDMPKMKEWRKELGQKKEPETFCDFWTSEEGWRCWYVFDKGFPQKEKEKMIKALRLELKNHKFQKNI